MKINTYLNMPKLYFTTYYNFAKHLKQLVLDIFNGFPQMIHQDWSSESSVIGEAFCSFVFNEQEEKRANVCLHYIVYIKEYQHKLSRILSLIP